MGRICTHLVGCSVVSCKLLMANPLTSLVLTSWEHCFTLTSKTIVEDHSITIPFIHKTALAGRTTHKPFFKLNLSLTFKADGILPVRKARIHCSL